MNPIQSAFRFVRAQLTSAGRGARALASYAASNPVNTARRVIEGGFVLGVAYMAAEFGSESGLPVDFRVAASLLLGGGYTAVRIVEARREAAAAAAAATAAGTGAGTPPPIPTVRSLLADDSIQIGLRLGVAGAIGFLASDAAVWYYDHLLNHTTLMDGIAVSGDQKGWFRKDVPHLPLQYGVLGLSLLGGWKFPWVKNHAAVLTAGAAVGAVSLAALPLSYNVYEKLISGVSLRNILSWSTAAIVGVGASYAATQVKWTHGKVILAIGLGAAALAALVYVPNITNSGSPPSPSAPSTTSSPAPATDTPSSDTKACTAPVVKATFPCQLTIPMGKIVYGYTPDDNKNYNILRFDIERAGKVITASRIQPSVGGYWIEGTVNGDPRTLYFSPAHLDNIAKGPK